MKQLFKFLCVTSSLWLASCYEDKSNYDYHEINDIEIVSSSYVYTTPPEGMTREILIEPTITQTMTSGSENLAYEWKRRVDGLSWSVVGHEATYKLVVTSNDTQDIYLRFAVTDTDQDIITYEEIVVRPIFAFNQCWFILQNENDQAVLGSVDGEGAVRVVTHDIYKQETGRSFSGKPTGLGLHPFMRLNNLLTDPGNPIYAILLGVFTDTEPYILNGSTLENFKWNYQRLLYEKRIKGDATFAPWSMIGCRNNLSIVDDGKLWMAFCDSFGLCYTAKLDPALGGEFDYQAALLGYGVRTLAPSNVIYDSRGNRFLFHQMTDAFSMGLNDRQAIANGNGDRDNLYTEDRYNAGGTLVSLATMSEEAKVNAAFDPDHLPGDIRMDYMGLMNSQLTYNATLAVGHNSSNELLVYEFNQDALSSPSVGDLSFCNAYWNIRAEGDVSALQAGELPVASSLFFNRMFFYAAGNKVYRVDMSFSEQIPTVSLVYEYPDADSKITHMKFKSDCYDIIENGTNKEIQRHLGLIVEDAGGNACLVELLLTVAGEIERDRQTDQPIVYTFDGDFKHVVDFTFSFRETI